MVEKVISGGQTGADQAGLRAAKRLGLQTGGWIPKGCPTDDGPRPILVKIFGMCEHTSALYPPRTFANVRDSDGTMRFASDWHSSGERCTKKAIDQYRRPYFDVDVNDPPPVEEARRWLEENNIRVLNVAGNRERTSPGIRAFVEAYLAKVLSHERENP